MGNSIKIKISHRRTTVVIKYLLPSVLFVSLVMSVYLIARSEHLAGTIFSQASLLVSVFFVLIVSAYGSYFAFILADHVFLDENDIHIIRGKKHVHVPLKKFGSIKFFSSYKGSPRFRIHFKQENDFGSKIDFMSTNQFYERYFKTIRDRDGKDIAGEDLYLWMKEAAFVN